MGGGGGDRGGEREIKERKTGWGGKRIREMNIANNPSHTFHANRMR
jgi:hypothetical protein